MPNLSKQSFYFGGQVRYGKPEYGALGDYLQAINWDLLPLPNGGVAGRAYAGWNFNRYFAVEGGYTRFIRNNYQLLFGPSATLDTHAWDIVSKTSLPLEALTPTLRNFDLYGKAGAAYITSKFNPGGSGVMIADTDIHNWEPTYGLGLAYNFTQNFAMDLSWTQIYGHGSDLTALRTPETNLYAVGAMISIP